MRLTDALLGEHGVLITQLSRLTDLARDAADPMVLRAALDPVAAALIEHARIEEGELFPAAERHKSALMEAMCAEHAEIEALIERARRGTSVTEVADAIDGLYDAAREHFEREEEVLFPDLDASVPSVYMEELGARWAKLRGVRVG